MPPTESTTCPPPSGKKCVAGTIKRSAPFCIESGDCKTLHIIEVTTLAADCSGTSTYEIIDPITGAVTGVYTGQIKKVACDAMRVRVVDACQPAPDPTLGVDCNDDPSRRVHDKCLTDVANEILAEIKKPKFDREFVQRCDKVTGELVLIRDVSDTSSPPGTAPTFEAWSAGGGTWVGNISTDLTDCGAEKYDIVTQPVCVSGQQQSRTDFFSVSPRALVGSIWQDSSGAVIAAPASGTYQLGECGDYQRGLRCYKENGVVRQIEAWAAVESGLQYYAAYELSGAPVTNFNAANIVECATLINDAHYCQGSTCKEVKAFYTGSGALSHVTTLAGVLVDEDWTQIALREGGCIGAECQTKKREAKVYYASVLAGGNLSMAQIVAAAQAGMIHSVQVAIVGVGSSATISGDTGAIDIDIDNPTYSHSAISGVDYQDNLTHSNWSVAVQSGKVNISAMYSL